ncbi:MAG: FtsX-like permease family protein [Candidatus Limnocylindria bacterium]
MSMLVRHVLHLVSREPRRSAAAALGVAIGSALLVAVVLFGAASGATLTQRALAGIPIDGQAVLATTADAASVDRILGADAAVARRLPFTLVHFDSATALTAGAATQTSTGVLVGIDGTYTAATGLFSMSSGTQVSGAVAISRDLATNLGITPGDTVTFSLPGGASSKLTVSGIVETTGSDLLLGPVDAAHRAAGANPPTNVAVTDLATATQLASLVPPGATVGLPDGGAAGSGGPVVASEEAAVRHEIQVQYVHAQLPGNPADAQTWLDVVRRRMEQSGAGSFTLVDDASASLQQIAGDLAWGQILFIFLALPGVALALTLSRFAAESSADATRRHAALLRARGASSREIGAIFVGAVGVNSFIGAIGGAMIGTGVAFMAFGGELQAAGAAVAVPVLAALAAAILLAVAAAISPIRDQIAGEVAAGRAELQQGRRPLWQRVYLDLFALGAAGAIYWAIGGTGVHPVLNAEGNPTVTLAFTSFLPALLLWTGGTLLMLRLGGRFMSHGGALAGALRRTFGAGGEVAGHALRARAAAASRAIVLLGLAVSFAASVLIFNATYLQQQSVDAELTLGADLRATPTSVTDATAVASATGPGVTAVTAFVDRVAYVGSEAQDLLAIDPATLPAVSPLSDSFFQGATADAAIQTLMSQPDAILVSAETALDYSLVTGDRVRIRVPDAHGNLRQVDFHMAGVALEFPTAPRDAFLVANFDYVATQTDNPAISYLLARQGSVDARSQLAQRLGSGWTVTDLSTTTARLANNVTSIDLGALVTLDIAFALLIASLGVGLFLLAGLSERRRELATLRAIGASPGQMRAGVAAEASVIGLFGTIIGLVTGGVLGLALLSILAGIFDPPADLPAIPWLAVAGFVAAIAAGLALAVAVGSRAIDRIGVLSALRER